MYVVTGGAGFIGSNIIAEMEKRGMGPIIVADLLRENSKWKNISKRELFEVIEPESLFDFLNKYSSQVSAIIHMGAISSTLENDVDLLLKVNFGLSKDLWDWCAKNRVPFIYASSAATYGDGSKGFDDNGSVDYLEKLKPLNPYGWSKHLFDRRVARFLEEEGDRVELVHSQDSKASERLASFQASDANWLVSVDMCSEGFDASRLRVIAYLSTVVTRSRFIQSITRTVRMSKARSAIESVPRQPSYVFAPADPLLMKYAKGWTTTQPYLVEATELETSSKTSSFLSKGPVLPMQALNARASSIIKINAAELPNFLK